VQPSVRSARSEDLSAIVRLYLEVAEEVFAREPTLCRAPDASAVERRYRSRIEETDRAVLVAESDVATIGFVDTSLWRNETGDSYQQPGIHAHVEELVVASSARRGHRPAAGRRRVGQGRRRPHGLGRYPHRKRRGARLVRIGWLPGVRCRAQEGAVMFAGDAAA
jgi:hypothetical protein